MNDTERLKEALDYATRKHEGQCRVGGEPYITHPVAVEKIVKEWGGDTDARITALFHDLLEDTDAKEEEIEAIGGPEVLQAVRLLTKKKGYDMAEYTSGIEGNAMAKLVKGADRLHNLQTAFCTDEKFKRKYIDETKKWYMDLAPGIADLVKRLEDSCKQS